MLSPVVLSSNILMCPLKTSPNQFTSLQGKSKTRQAVDLLAEPVYIETSERQQEENMVSVDVNKVHVQLRRLKNESALLKDASVTAIPNHRSKVRLLLFTIAHLTDTLTSW